MITVLLPWQTVTASMPGLPRDMTTTTTGLGSVWGWVTLPCAAAAAVFGVLGGVRSKGGLTAAAAAPALIGLLMLAVVAALPKFRKPTVPNVEGLPPQLAYMVNSHAKASLDFGWCLAVLLTLLVIGLSIASLALTLRRNATEP